MARIAGIQLDDKWKVDYALTKIKGVGWPLSKKLLSILKIENTKRIKDLSEEEISKIASKIEEYPIEGELFRVVRSNLARLKNIGSYRGLRHSRSLPTRGQRTKTNARTRGATSY